MIAGRAREAYSRGLGLKAALLSTLLLAGHHCASAQETTQMVRVGVLASAETHPTQSFGERLRELGWVEGKTSGSIIAGRKRTTLAGPRWRPN